MIDFIVRFITIFSFLFLAVIICMRFIGAMMMREDGNNSIRFTTELILAVIASLSLAYWLSFIH